jgi:hypothetical protein
MNVPFNVLILIYFSYLLSSSPTLQLFGYPSPKEPSHSRSQSFATQNELLRQLLPLCKMRKLILHGPAMIPRFCFSLAAAHHYEIHKNSHNPKPKSLNLILAAESRCSPTFSTVRCHATAKARDAFDSRGNEASSLGLGFSNLHLK